MSKRWSFLLLFISFSLTVVSMAQAVFVDTQQRKDSSRVIFRWDKKPEYNLVQKKQSVTITFDRTYNVSVDEIKSRLKDKRLELVGISNDNGKLSITFNMLKKGYAQTLSKGNNVLIDFIFRELKPKDQKKKDKTAEKIAKAEKPVKEVTTEKKELDAQVTEKNNVVPLIIDEEDGTLKLVFDFNKNIKAGAFIEGNDLWLFFDQPTQFAWDEAKLKSSQIISGIQTYKNDRMSALQLDLLEEPDTTSFFQRDFRWILQWPDTRDVKTPNLQAHIVHDEVSGQNEMRFSKLDLGEPIYADMPGTGHPRYFIASSGQQLKVSPQYMSIDFYMPPTLQGIVIDPLSENISVETEDKDIVISKIGGLIVSSLEDRTKKRVRYEPPSLFSFDGWETQYKQIEEAVRELESEIIATPKHMRTPKRLKLVRYYLITGREYEALGMLDAAKHYDPSLNDSPYFYSLRGLAYFLAGHYERAHEDFSNPIISYEPEMNYWAEISYSAIDPYNVKYGELAEGLKYLKKYPVRIKNLILLNMLHSALHQNENPKPLYELIQVGTLNETQKEQLAHYRTLDLLNSGNVQQAKKAIEQDVKNMSSQYKYRNQFLLTRLQSEEGQHTPEEEIKQLKKLALKWTGDRFEYDVWKRMSELYEKQANLNQSLKYLSKALRHHPRYAHHDDIEQRGQKIFAAAMKSQQLDSIDKIAIYMDYPGFIPEDHRRVDIKDQLIQILFAADLVEEAQKLTKELIEDPTLNDDQKFSRKLDYASLALISFEAEKALECLDTLPNEQLNSKLIKDKNLMQAQANLMLKNTDKVRNILKNENGEEAFDMICQSYFIDKDWNGLKTYTKERLKKTDQQSLTPEPNLLVWLATSLLMLNKKDDLLNLGANYKDQLQSENEGKLFELFTSADPIDFTNTNALEEQLLEGRQISDVASRYLNKLSN